MTGDSVQNFGRDIMSVAATMSRMRTTVTLDPDVVEQVRALARRRKISFKAALNSVVRVGLAPQRGGSRPYKVPARRMGLRADLDLTQALRLAGSLEDEEIVRKLEFRD
jgi:hypothetical protein